MFKNICDKLATIGQPVKDMDKLHWFLCRLGVSYETFSTAILTSKPSPLFEIFSLMLKVMNCCYSLFMVRPHHLHPFSLNKLGPVTPLLEVVKIITSHMVVVVEALMVAEGVVVVVLLTASYVEQIETMLLHVLIHTPMLQILCLLMQIWLSLSTLSVMSLKEIWTGMSIPVLLLT